MKSFRAAGLCALLCLSVSALSGCASAVSGAWQDPPPLAASPQSIMTAKTCSDLPINHEENINAPGWERKAPTGVQAFSCGGKYASGTFFCMDPSKCGELTYSTIPADPKDRGKKWHGIIDLMEGSVSACAEPANRFGVGNLDCKGQPLAGLVRGVFETTVPGISPGAEQTSTTVMLSIRPAGTAKIVIGQLGFAESPSPTS